MTDDRESSVATQLRLIEAYRTRKRPGGHGYASGGHGYASGGHGTQGAQMTTQPSLFGGPDTNITPRKNDRGRCPICHKLTMWERLYHRHYRCTECRAGIVGRD